MSSRALRKLQRAEAAKTKAADGDDEADEAVAAEAGELAEDSVSHAAEEAARRAGGRGNQFALLMAAGGAADCRPASDDDDGDNNDDGGDKSEEAAEPTDEAKKKARKKKKKKHKMKQTRAEEEAAAAEGLLDVPASATTASADRHDGGGGGGARGSVGGSIKPLLGVDLRLLDGGQELRRLFGQAAGERLPTLRGGGGGGARRGLLVQPKPTWPPVVRLGLSMSPDPEAAFASDAFPPGSSVHRFQHSREYQRTQVDFADAVESGDPERLAEIIRRQPYHVDSLLQLAEVFRMQEDAATAADLVERALYALECAMSTGFSLVTDRCRLSFARRENRAMFVALLRHALSLAARCCHRACLETCKLLLSLSPAADPMGSLLLLDAACLMSGQEDFLLRLMAAWEPTRHLSQLPNWAYSGALARFRLGRPGADAALDEALILFPSVLPALLSRLSVDPGPRVSGCRLFVEAAAAAAAESQGLRQLCGLYVHRCGHCWKEAPAVTFLVAGAARVAAAASTTPPDPRVAEFAERRRRRYRRAPLNILRHLVASDAPGALSDLPPDLDPAGLNAFDPLPPPDSVCDYDVAGLRRRLRARGSGGGGGADDSGLMGAFLRSLMPNYDPNAVAADAGAAGGGGGSGGGGLAGLLDSVRQLLNGLGPPPPPPNGAEGPPPPEEEGLD